MDDMSLREMNQAEIRRIMDTVPGGIFRCEHASGWEITEANDGFFRFLDYTREEFSQRFHNSFAAVIHPDDLPYISSAMDQALSAGSHVNTQNRVICRNGVIKWIDIQAERLIDENGGDYLYCIFVDITEQAELKQELKLYRTSNLIGVFSVMADDGFTLLYGNDKYYQIHGQTKESLLGGLHNRCSEYIHPDDLPAVKKAVSLAIERGESFAQGTMRIVTGNRSIRHVLCSGVIQKQDGRTVINGTVMDITDQKMTEAALRDRDAKLRIATENSDVSFWTYDHEKREIITTAISKKLHNNVERIENSPESLIASGYVHRDSVEPLRRLHAELRAGAKTASAELWFQTKDKRGWWCEHIDYTNFFDRSGEPIYAQGIGKDVTATKNAERKYREEMDYAQATQSDKLLARVRSNLTQNTVESYIAQDAVTISADGVSYDKTAERIVKTGLTPEEQKKLSEFLSAKRILQKFENGESTGSLEYRRKTKDDIIWVKTTVKCYHNPETGDAMAFMYTYDVNDERTKDRLIEAVTSLEYDYIAYIDLKKDRLKLYLGGERFKTLLPNESGSYTESVYHVNRSIVAPEDVERAISDMLPEGIRGNLNGRKMFSTVYSVYDDNRNVRQKRMQFAYLDEIAEQVIITRTDITDIMEQQKRQQQTLESALLAAERANSAKSDFLSRMSHEIRTPMNAIIGMSAIAAQSIGDDEQVAGCIEKIRISSQFLLSLINDILDMSRIESGKMELNNEIFAFGDFINGINSICSTQAKAKEIDYECFVAPDVEKNYIGDVMKLQQVMINLLSNAVKFTPEHGRIALNVLQTENDGKKATLRFIVSDNGRGISDSYMPRLFDAFSQEDSGTTTQYGGTGLGLAICKNLVEMMEGHIGVQSSVGVGSRFTVDVKLGVASEAELQSMDGSDDRLHKDAPESDIRFDGKRILLAEDHPLNVEVAKRLLENRGFTVDHAENGLKALEMFSAAPDGYYSAILMDIRMPQMDGLQAAIAIRRLEKPTAQTVPIIAMTANAFDEDIRKSMEAGMNAHLAKPIEPGRLYQTLERFIFGNRRSVCERK